MPTPEIEQYSWMVSVTRCSSVNEFHSGVPKSVDHSGDRPKSWVRDRSGPVDVDDRVVGLLGRRAEEAGGEFLAVDRLLATAGAVAVDGSVAVIGGLPRTASAWL